MQETWDSLAAEIDTVFHNGATVNYLFNYDMMRDANVLGTNEILRLAFEGRPKEFNYVSTTFIFGWAHKSTLYETDCNADMALLDFGYSQTKWVAEQVVFACAAEGLVHARLPPGAGQPFRGWRRQQLRYRHPPGRVHGESWHRRGHAQPGQLRSG